MRAYDFRCSPNNGHRQDTSACPFLATADSLDQQRPPENPLSIHLSAVTPSGGLTQSGGNRRTSTSSICPVADLRCVVPYAASAIACRPLARVMAIVEPIP